MTRTPRRPSPTPRRDRAPRGRHRLDRRSRRPAGYAAAGLIALTGAVTGVTLNPAPQPAPVAAAEVVAVRAMANRSPQVVTLRRAAPVRKAKTTRWVSRTVDGRVLRGRATWYGPGFAGRRTASGEVFQPRHALTAAHRTLPFGTRLRVCRRDRCVVVRINDRGPFGNAILDLSWLAAHRIGLDGPGIAPVTATVLHTRRVRVRS